MIAVLRSAFALTLKEIQHHLLAVFFIAVWSMMMIPIAVVGALASGGTSFAAAGLGLVYYYGPLVVFLVVRRLVVIEYEDGTIRFLDALPAPAWLQLWIKAVIGWVASVGIALAMALPLLIFAALREFVTFGWFLQLGVAIALYISAWLALTMGVAHTGRIRHWVWMSMLVFFGSADLGDQWQHWSWLAALAEPADATRHALPWLDFAVSLLWTGALSLFAIFLATFRGGAIPAALFQSASTRERVTGTSWILALYIVVEVWPEVGPGTLNGWEALPTPEPGIRVAGEVGDWPEAARETLDALDGLAKLDPPTDLVLAAMPTGPGAPTGPTLTTDLWDRDELIVRVRPEVSVGGRADLVRSVLTQRSAGMLQYADDRAFAVDGLGLYLAEDRGDRRVARLRAALAMRRGLTHSDLANWEEVRWQLGEDLAAGVGAIGLASAEELASRKAVGDWVGVWLFPVLPEASRAARQLGHTDRPAGVDPSALDARWWAALTAIAAEVDTDALPVLDATVHRPEDPTSPLDLAWEFFADVPAGAQLYARPVDPTRGRPVPFERDYRELLLPLTEPAGTTPTWFDGQEAVEATVRLWVPEIDGYLVAGWWRLEP